jgi:hypothetical protein
MVNTNTNLFRTNLFTITGNTKLKIASTKEQRNQGVQLDFLANYKMLVSFGTKTKFLTNVQIDEKYF